MSVICMMALRLYVFFSNHARLSHEALPPSAALSSAGRVLATDLRFCIKVPIMLPEPSFDGTRSSVASFLPSTGCSTYRCIQVPQAMRPFYLDSFEQGLGVLRKMLLVTLCYTMP